MLSLKPRKPVIRVGRNISPSHRVPRDKHRKMLEKVSMTSKNPTVKPTEISRCISINRMHATTALQKQLNKIQHCEHSPGLPTLNRCRGAPSSCMALWNKRTDTCRELAEGQKNRLGPQQNILFLCPKKL